MSKRKEEAATKAAAAKLGSRGGKARGKKLSAKRRAAIARHAANVRWGKAKSGN